MGHSLWIVYLFASVIVDNPSILVLISILGALFMFKMGVECFSIEPPTLSSILEPTSSKRHSGGERANESPESQCLCFLVLDRRADYGLSGGIRASSTTGLCCHIHVIGIILVKCLIAIMLHRMRDAMPRHIYKFILSLCGVAMIIFALGYLAFAWSQYQSI